MAIIIVILVIYMAGMLAIGFAGKKKSETMTDFLTAGKSGGMFVMVCTYIGAHVGNGIVVGGAQYGAEYGIGGVWFGLGACLSYVLFALVMSRLLYTRGYITIPDLIRDRYKSKFASVLMAVLNICATLGIMAAQIMAGCTLFRITVNGVGCHGAMPEKGVDPLNIASHIYLSLQEIISREIGAKTPAVVTIGRMTGGEAPNIIPQTAVLEGTIRSFDRDLSAQIFTRIGEIAQCTAQAFRGTAVTEEITSAPPLRNDAALTNRMADLAGALFGEKLVYRLDEGGTGSEDFASYTYDLPCAYLLIGAGTKQENPAFGEPMHNERVVFNEDILPRGAALHTWCALNWLADKGNA